MNAAQFKQLIIGRTITDVDINGHYGDPLIIESITFDNGYIVELRITLNDGIGAYFAQEFL